MKKFVLALVFGFIALCINAQDKARMADFAAQLDTLFGTARYAPTDNQRYLASEQAVQLMAEALNTEGSMSWKWNFGDKVSVLTSPDKKVRLITWPVLRDNGEWECFGFIQYLNAATGKVEFAELNDKSDELINREETIVDPSNWYGAVYQEIIQTSNDGKTYYTLLGYNGVDNITQRKVIEPVWFKPSTGKPQFGQALFRRERNLRRVVLEYSNSVMVNLRFEEQFVREVERKRVKVKGSKNRYRTVEVVHEHKEKMIMFDEVAPQVEGMEGLYQYYVPSGEEMAYAFVGGKWELRRGAEGRLDDKRLNKPFEPIEKQAPSYSTR
ncbi:MAG: hypothetical protein IJ789_07155 [Bacteroidales bacterium]|nr:hypothetical protein [Bacteroidales bacterium]